MILAHPDSTVIFFLFIRTCYAELGYEPQFAEDELKDTHGEIVFSAMLFRHGDRNPVGNYPTNPHAEVFRQAGRARLTQLGKDRAYRLGIWARKRYQHLIMNRPYRADLLNVISSDADRTISSAQLFLAGFYPPTDKREIWNPHIYWQPIPVYSLPSYVDRLLRPESYCARYNLEVERIKHSPRVVDFHQTYTELYDYIEEHAGIKIPRDDVIMAINKASEFYDNLYVQEQMGLEHPTWVTKIYPWPLRDISIMYFKMHTLNTKMRQLKGGPLLEHIINEFRSKRDNQRSRKIFQIYSGHDATLIGLMDLLGVYDETKAHYSASILAELRLLNQDYIVTILYRNVEDATPQLLEIPKCPSPCTLDKFIEVTKSAIPEDLESECENLDPDYNKILY